MLKLASFGTIQPPPSITGLSTGGPNSGIPNLVSIALKTLIVGAAVYALFNFVLAGYAYISAAGDPKSIQLATAKIWQSIIGLVVAAGAFLIAGVVGQLVFGDPNVILQIQLFK